MEIPTYELGENVTLQHDQTLKAVGTIVLEQEGLQRTETEQWCVQELTEP